MEFILIHIYFLPTIVALFRGKPTGCAIALLNLFLGWTVIGWIIALKWALTDDKADNS